MKASKSTLADLDRLRKQATEEAEQAPRKPHKAMRPRGPSRRTARRTGGSGAAATEPLQAPQPEAGVVLAIPDLAAEDRALFQQAMRFVQPLARHGNRARHLVARDPDGLLRERRAHAQGAAAAAEPAPLRTHRRAPAALDPDAQEFLQPGCGTDLLRSLRRGKWPAQAILDLHGSTEDEAYDRLDRFIATCVTHDIRCVCIVHGKGMGSRHGTPVLKTAVRLRLCRLQAVQAWVQCAEPDGGAGAVMALLRLPPEKSTP